MLCVVETGHPKVKATAYVHKDKVLISIGNFSDREVEVNLQIDWDQLELDPEQVIFKAPEIEDFQEAHSFERGDAIAIGPRRGWLLYLEPI